MKFHYISKKERKQFLNNVQKLYPYIDLEKLRDIEKVARVEIDKFIIMIIGSIPAFFYIDDEGPYPLLLMLNTIKPKIPYVVVNEGAIRPIMRGADVMVPGIIELSEFKRNDIVGVMEPSKKAFIAVTKALMSSDEIRERSKGCALRTLHYANDKLWKSSLELARKLSL